MKRLAPLLLLLVLAGCSSGSSGRRVASYLTFAGVVLITEAEIRAEDLTLEELRAEQAIVDGVIQPAIQQIEMGVEHYSEVLQREIDERIAAPPPSPGMIGLRPPAPRGPNEGRVACNPPATAADFVQR